MSEHSLNLSGHHRPQADDDAAADFPRNQDSEERHVQSRSSSISRGGEEFATVVSQRVSHTHHNFHFGGSNSNSNTAAVGSEGGGPSSYFNYHSCAVDDENDPHHYFIGGPSDHDHDDPSYSRLLRSRIHHRRRHVWLAALCHPFQCLLASEQLCRSFCFGAIDGMLTGAGILSACAGLGLLSMLESSSSDGTSALSAAAADHIKWVPLALTLSATFSDGICMAIGHVWSTSLLAAAAHGERKEELRNFAACRSDAKSRLVDALLLEGMLKIDAMSIADTLEGYPDLFVNALLGGGFNASDGGGSGGHHHAQTGSGMLFHGGGGGGGSGTSPMEHGKRASQELPSHSWDISSGSSGPGMAGESGLNHEMHGETSGYFADPTKDQPETVAESRLEGLLMMSSFSTFSAIPSLIYTLLPPMVNLFAADGVAHFDGLVKILSVSIAATVMFLLGVWKSHFYSSNWFSCGLRNIGVFVICVATGYSFGFAFRLFIGSC